MRRMRARRALAGGAVLAIAAAGCTSEPPVDGDPVAEATAAVDIDATEAAELRLLLEQQFALFTAATIAVVREPKASAGSAPAAADKAVEDLEATVADAYDRQTAQAFSKVLARYPAALSDYARALADDSETLIGGVRPTVVARRALMRLPMELAAAMSSVTGGGMEEEGTAALVRAPTVALLQTATAHVEDDFETAYIRQREAHAAMVSVGRAFAAGISEQQPDVYPGLRNTGAIELRSALQQLLGEHALLAGEVLRRGLRSAPDFEAAAAALNGNTEDLTAALDSIYGDGAEPFGTLWRQRISTLAESAVALAEKRAKRAGQLRATLARVDARIAAALAAMSDDTISADDATAALRSVTQRLLELAEASAGKKFDRANQLAAAAHASASGVAEVAAAGIAEHRPSEFPAR